MELTAQVHSENDSDWAEITELPGCFASGDTLDELRDALGESARLYLEEGASAERAALDSLSLVVPVTGA